MRPKGFLSLWYVRRKICTHLALGLALPPNGSKELSLQPCHLGVPSRTSNTLSKPMVHLAQIMHLSCTDTNTVSKWTKTSFPHDPCHLGVPSRASKMFSEPMVCSAQTMHLSCVKIRTTSKRTKTSFHLSLVTKGYH